MAEDISSVKQSDKNTKGTHPVRFGLLMGGVLLLSVWVRIIFWDNFLWTYDEGIHVLLARMLAAGYEPYRELFVSYPPLFVWSLEWPWRIWGTVQSIQFVMIGYALLGVVAAGVLAFHLGDWLAGLIAAIVVSFSATYLIGSRAVLTEVPSVGVGVLAVTLAAHYYWSGRHGWLLASGLAMSASLMLKILSPFVAGLVALMLLIRQIEQQKAFTLIIKNTVRDGLIWGIGLLVPLLFVLVLYDASAMYRQVIAFRLDTRTAYSGDWAESIDLLVAFIRDNLPVVLAMVWGGLVIHKKQWRAGWFVLAWLVLAVAFALMQVPLRDKHLPLLLPPMAVLAGVGLAEGWYNGLSIWRGHRSASVVMSLTAAVVLTGAYVRQVTIEFTTLAQTVTTPLEEDERRLVEYLGRFTSPNDCLVTDDPSLAFFAGRLVPPNLSEVSSARLRSGYLTFEELVSGTQAYGCQVVAPVAQRLKRTRSDFVEWTKQHFLGLWLYDGETEVLVAQPVAEAHPAHALQAGFDGQVELLGYDLVHDDVDSGTAIFLSLYWRALQTPLAEYTIFVHVRDGGNTTVLNGDHQPYDNLVPTSRWPEGKVVKETIRLDIPPELPKGEYQVAVGLYRPDTLERLRLDNDTSGENAAIIRGVLVR